MIDAPALVKDTHALGRRVGHKEGWENLSVFERAHRAGKLMDRERCTDQEATKAEAERALDRYQAGDRFTEGWKVANAGNWANGSDYNSVRVVGCPGSFVDHQIDVKNFMRALEAELGTRDWMILRRICGENYPIADTITDITPAYRATTLARFRESLDALIEAIPLAFKKAGK
jgi:hypothetical protein